MQLRACHTFQVFGRITYTMWFPFAWPIARMSCQLVASCNAPWNFVFGYVCQMFNIWICFETGLGPQLFIRMPSVKVNIAFFYWSPIATSKISIVQRRDWSMKSLNWTRVLSTHPLPSLTKSKSKITRILRLWICDDC